jgi:hypothetical protein
MPTIGVEKGLLTELFSRRDLLVRTVASGAESGQWEPVMPAFDDLLESIARLEAAVQEAGGN